MLSHRRADYAICDVYLSTSWSKLFFFNRNSHAAQKFVSTITVHSVSATTARTKHFMHHTVCFHILFSVLVKLLDILFFLNVFMLFNQIQQTKKLFFLPELSSCCVESICGTCLHPKYSMNRSACASVR